MKLSSKINFYLAAAGLFAASCSSVDKLAANRPGRVKTTSTSQAQPHTPAGGLLERVELNAKAMANLPAAAMQATPAMNDLQYRAAKAELNEALSRLNQQVKQDGKVTAKEKRLVKKVNRAIATATKAKPNGEGKSQVTAIALSFAFLIGFAGMHRFYLGYTLEGVIQLCTWGVFLIWQIIDIINLFSGNLKPKDGEYDIKL